MTSQHYTGKGVSNLLIRSSLYDVTGKGSFQFTLIHFSLYDGTGKGVSSLLIRSSLYDVTGKGVSNLLSAKPAKKLQAQLTSQAQPPPAKRLRAQVTPAKKFQAQPPPAKTLQAQLTPAKTLQAQLTPAKTLQAQVPPAKTLLAQPTPAKTLQAQPTPAKTCCCRCSCAIRCTTSCSKGRFGQRCQPECGKHQGRSVCAAPKCTINPKLNGFCTKHGGKGNKGTCILPGCTSNTHTRGQLFLCALLHQQFVCSWIEID
jgi:hypothetical protein